MNGITYHKGRYFKPITKGLTHSDKNFDPALLVPKASGASSTVMVHGFRYDPFINDYEDNPHLGTFRIWKENIVLPNLQPFGFGWWSCPFGRSSIWKAWCAGHWNTYKYAWKLAEVVAPALATTIKLRGGKVDILCHSLGSRVVLRTLAMHPDLNVRNVVFMNGAALSDDALLVAGNYPSVQFHNLIVRSDDLLRTFGQIFSPGGVRSGTIGQAGLSYSPSNWYDIDINSELTRMNLANQGFPGVTGDNPDGDTDHWWTYKNPANWPYLRYLLSG